MSETLIPTMSLRFVEREGAKAFDINTSRFGGPVEKVKYRVLQQMFRDPHGGDLQIWRDVPLIQDPV